VGTPRGLQGRLATLAARLARLWTFTDDALALITSEIHRQTAITAMGEWICSV
jgi:hypothetical protein